MLRRQKFSPGDLVHFREGRKIDWTVLQTFPGARVGEPQRLVVESGMSGKRLHTTAEHVVPRPVPEVLRAVEAS